MSVAELMAKLPEEIIIQHICPYLYKPQSKDLCDDIKSFVYTKKYLYDLYYSKYSLRTYNKEWLLADITRFINGYNSYFFRYSNLYYARVKKLFMLKDKKLEFVHKFICKIEHQLPKGIGIHIKLGILNPKERKGLIGFLKYIEVIP